MYYHLGLHRDPKFGPIGDKILHRAGPDAVMTGALFYQFAQMISLEQMADISEKPILQRKVGFGKHFGKLWDEVDMGYINWILGKADDFDEDVVYTARCQKIERAKR